MNYYAVVSLFNGVVVLCIGFYLLSCQRQNPLYQSFAAFAACVGLWCVFYAVWQIQTTKSEALMYMRLAMMAVYPAPFAFLLFVLNLVGWNQKRWVSLSIFGTAFFFMLFGFTRLMIKDMVPVRGFPFWPDPGILMHCYLSVFVSMVLFSYGILFRAYRNSQGIQKWQIQWVIWTLLPGWIGGGSNWFLWYGIPVLPIPNFFVGAGFLILSYGIIRSRLFDIDALTDFVQEAKLSALGIMATSINHEVRNPLFVIRGLAETQLDRLNVTTEGEREQLVPKLKEMLLKTIQQTDKAIEIIRSFSEYSKRQSAKTLEKRRLDLRSVLESIIPLVRSELALDEIRLNVDIPSGTSIFADQHSVEEIFLNLIVNACQAIKETSGGGDIHITAKEESPWTVIKVRDTGPGLAPDQLERVFEPFYTTKTSGTGLGLYVVKQLIRKNGGRVEVLACNGSGTAFILAFPAL